MHRSRETVELLMRRRSVVANKLGAPGPNAEELTTLLTIAARVPDHKKIAPWRFLVFEGDARAAFGAVLRDALIKREPEAEGSVRADTEAGRLTRAPVVIAVISSLRTDKPVPEWEQILSAGASCQNLLIGANALGYSAQWITEWYSYDPDVTAALGLAENERVAGFIYIGTAVEAPQERDRPVLDDIVRAWRTPGD